MVLLRASDIFVPPAFTSSKNHSAVSPEPFPLVPAPANNAMVGPFPPVRQLSHPGVCKVLVVDDSRTNVKIMIRLVNQVSGDCFHRPGSRNNNRATTTSIDACGTNITSVSGSGKGRKKKEGVVGRGRSYHYSPGGPGGGGGGGGGGIGDYYYSSEEEEDEEVEVIYAEADDGQVAVKMVQEASKAGSPYDIVFMDNTMRTMHGPEAAQQMRAGGFAGLIVGVTGNVMAEDLDKYTQSGADYVLGKPVKVDELQQILLQFN